jgi:preprotein translocase subunit Sec63
MKLAWILIFGFYVALVVLIFARLTHRWWRRSRERPRR